MTPSKIGKTGSTLSQLSTELADAVQSASSSIVAIHARRRIPSSGIVWRDGVIVSASHTVRKDDDIAITLPDGESTAATVIGRDAATDLIALRIATGSAKPLAAPAAGDDTARVGALVIAAGRPGRDVTASFGIISAIREGWRTWQGGGGGARIDKVLRLDLAIYDGFSGGPLLDAGGARLGIDNSALGRGMPMALPAVAVDSVIDELLERGHVRRPFIGVAVQPVMLPSALVRQHQLANDTALLILSVGDGSPAERGGLFVGDALLEANGHVLRHPTDLLDVLAGVTPETDVELKVLRGGAMKQLSIAPVDRGVRT